MKIGKWIGTAVFLLLMLAGCGDQPGMEGPGRFQVNPEGIILDTSREAAIQPD